MKKNSMKKLVFFIFFLITFSLCANAQILASADPAADSAAFARVRARLDSIRQYRPTVGLVLAGGGARGLAHLGVIKYIEELGIPVDVITGTSMGGLVGGLYALGYNHDQLDSLVRAIEWPVMMSDKIPNDYISYRLRKYRDRFIIRIPFHYDNEDIKERLERSKALDKMAAEAEAGSADMMRTATTKMGLGMPDGFLYGLNVRKTLSSVSVGYEDSLSFADLPIPYACVATDMYTMTPKYWTSGSINDAMRSTMAIPFYFRTVRRDGAVLLDGGMRNNYPADLAKEMGADIIIGSEMSTNRGIDELNSPIDLLFQTISLLSSGTVEPAMEVVDLDVHHELKGYNMLSFDEQSVDDIIKQGYQNALASKEMFESVAALVAGKEVPPVVHHAPAVNLAQTKVRVDSIRYIGITPKEKRIIVRKSDLPADGMYDRNTVERLMNNIYGTNVFESVTYWLEGSSEPYTLVFDCQKGQVNDSAVGIRADVDEAVAALLHLGLGTRRLAGPRFTADLKLGTNPALSLDFAYKFDKFLPTIGILSRTRLVNTSSDYHQIVMDRLLTSAVDLYLEDSQMRFGSMRVGLTAEMAPYEHYLTVDDLWYGWDWDSYWLSAFANFKLDFFDDAYFPNKGIKFTVNGRYNFKGYSIDIDPMYYHPVGDLTTEDGSAPRYVSVLSSLEGAFSIGKHFTILPSLYFGWNSVDNDYQNPLHPVSIGGFISNRYTERQIPFFGFPTGYRYCVELSSMGQLDLRYRFLHKNFVTLRGGLFHTAFNFHDLFTENPIYAFGTEYSRQTIVGPFRLAVQWCNASGVSVYTSIGFAF